MIIFADSMSILSMTAKSSMFILDIRSLSKEFSINKSIKACGNSSEYSSSVILLANTVIYVHNILYIRHENRTGMSGSFLNGSQVKLIELSGSIRTTTRNRNRFVAISKYSKRFPNTKIYYTR